MASVVKIKRSAVAGKTPTTSDIESGELALNTNDGRLYSSDGSAVFEIGANPKTLTINSAFSLPTVDGTAGQYLKTDGAGNATWSTIDTGSGDGIDSLGYTNSTKTNGTLFADSSVDLGALSGGQVTDAFGVLLDGEILDCLEPIRETRTTDFAALS